MSCDLGGRGGGKGCIKQGTISGVGNKGQDVQETSSLSKESLQQVPQGGESVCSQYKSHTSE